MKQTADIEGEITPRTESVRDTFGTIGDPGPGFCQGLLECLHFFNQIMPFCIISWSDSKLFRRSGGFFAEWWSGATSRGRTLPAPSLSKLGVFILLLSKLGVFILLRFYFYWWMLRQDIIAIQSTLK
jgi:hypothetical protein